MIKHVNHVIYKIHVGINTHCYKFYLLPNGVKKQFCKYMLKNAITL